jgi:TM2 domain-containing membrane protein YozV
MPNTTTNTAKNALTNTMKPLYFSALIFPGLGQFYLKTYIRGLLFTMVAAVGFAIIMEATFSIMMVIANDIEEGRQRLDVNSLALVIKESLTVFEDPTIITAKLAFLASWILSSLDAYITIKRHPDSA